MTVMRAVGSVACIALGLTMFGFALYGFCSYLMGAFDFVPRDRIANVLTGISMLSATSAIPLAVGYALWPWREP